MRLDVTMNKLPTLSILIVNKNGGLKLDNALKTISSQSYPKDLIEILIIDGESTDNSKELANKYQAKFIDGGFSDNQEARRFVGAKEAKNEIIVWIDSDNYLPTKDWLKRMVEPLVQDKDIFASETLHYAYRKTDRIFNRYFSLFGVNDPVAFYLGKADRATYYQNGWKLMGDAVDQGNYFKVTFSDSLPTVGCNGFLVRRELLKKVLTKPEEYFHIDVIFDLVKLGYHNIAFVKTDIIHDTSDTLGKLIRKRISYFSQHHVDLAEKRRYKVFDSESKKDNLLLCLFIVYTITIIRPFFDALRGFIKKRDFAWFLHPIVCWSFLYIYGMTIIRTKFLKLFTK